MFKCSEGCTALFPEGPLDAQASSCEHNVRKGARSDFSDKDSAT